MTSNQEFNGIVSIDEFLDWWLHHSVLEAKEAAILDHYYGSYRRHFGPYARHHYASQSQEIEALAKLKPGARLLEIGAGCGTEALWFALRGCSVLAIDVDRERLAVAAARQAVVERIIGRKLDLEFRLASVFELASEPAFDLVWMEQAFHHVEPRQQLYATLGALVRPGGHVVIADTNGWNPLLQARLFQQRGWQTIVDRTLPDGRRLYYGQERISIPTALARGFAAAGFDRRSVRYFRVMANSALADRWLRWERLVPGWLLPAFTHYVLTLRRAATA
ncbi:MAG: class I SAM-dependent methyltransferase [Geminicoccaceae bacterium]